MNKIKCVLCKGQLEFQSNMHGARCIECGLVYSLESLKNLSFGDAGENQGSRSDVQKLKELVKQHIRKCDFHTAKQLVDRISLIAPSDEENNDLLDKLQEWCLFEIQDRVLVKYNGRASKVTVPEGIVGIGEDAFSIAYQQRNLTSVNLPKSLERIENGAFTNCSLRKIRIPPNVNYIGELAFEGCDKLTVVTLENASLIDFGDVPFNACDNLAAIVDKDGTPIDIPGVHLSLKNQKQKDTLLADTVDQSTQWKNKGYCQHCGGSFKGLLRKKCVLCGKLKDY